MRIAQVYIPYWDWEDFKNGMWRRVDKIQEQEFLIKCIEFTGDHFRYGAAMKEVINKWPNTMLNTLTNSSVNHRAFVGHCACSYEFNCPEYITRMAWKELTDRQRIDADAIAQKHINKWKSEYLKHDRENNPVHQKMGVQVLF